jgi:hypothetical protein
MIGRDLGWVHLISGIYVGGKIKDNIAKGMFLGHVAKPYILYEYNGFLRADFNVEGNIRLKQKNQLVECFFQNA